MAWSDLKRWQQVLLFFIVSYAFVFALQAFASNVFGSWGGAATFYTAPFAGFVIGFYGVRWAADFFGAKSRQQFWGLVAVLAVMFLLAWQVALAFYYQNAVELQLKSDARYNNNQLVPVSPTCAVPPSDRAGPRNTWLDGFGGGWCIASEQYGDQLRQSPYLTFGITALFGVFAFGAARRD